MRHKSFKADACPVARSLDAIGEWWSLLIVRDALGGIRRLTPIFRRAWDWQRNVLSTRLKKLVLRAESWNRCRLRTASAYRGICPNPKRPGVVPGSSLLCASGVKAISSPAARRKRLQVLGQTHRKALSSTSTQRERGSPYGRTIWNWLLLRIEWNC